MLDASVLLVYVNSADPHFLDERFSDPGLGLTDAMLVVLAERFDTRDVAIFDHRHFRALTTPSGDAFRILRADLG